jgi:hypothetical protein
MQGRKKKKRERKGGEAAPQDKILATPLYVTPKDGLMNSNPQTRNQIGWHRTNIDAF